MSAIAYRTGWNLKGSSCNWKNLKYTRFLNAKRNVCTCVPEQTLNSKPRLSTPIRDTSWHYSSKKISSRISHSHIKISLLTCKIVFLLWYYTLKWLLADESRTWTETQTPITRLINLSRETKRYIFRVKNSDLSTCEQGERLILFLSDSLCCHIQPQPVERKVKHLKHYGIIFQILSLYCFG